MDFSKILLNPVRHRIIQYYTLHESATVKQLSVDLNDIPIASLYRHMKVLSDHNILLKVAERKTRGTMEVLYSLNPSWNCTSDNNERNVQVQRILADISARYNEYFAKENADSKSDFIFSTSAVMMLTDEEFKDYLKRVNEITQEYVSIAGKENSKLRHLIQFSVPEKKGE